MTTVPDADTTGSAPVAVGDHVLYRLSDGDILVINSYDPARDRRNPVYAGQVYPGIVVATFSSGVANIRVWLDGAGLGATYWATSRPYGAGAGQWTYRAEAPVPA